MATKLKTFEVTARLVLLVSNTIKAESLADAVQFSKDLKETDFVTIPGEFIDGSLVVTGVSRSDSWETKQEE